MTEGPGESARPARVDGGWGWTSRWLGFGLLIAALDRVTKAIAEARLELHTPVEVINGLNFVLTYNRGAAFSLLSEAGGWQRWLFAAIAVLVSVFLVQWLHGLPRTLRWMPTALSLVLGGALGNLYDRLVYGKVVDFVDVYYQGWHWPAFNLADSAICIGAGMLIVAIFRGDDRPVEAQV